jgi:hypothetical protein
LTIAPDEKSSADSPLRKYRIIDGKIWIGTVYLSPECANTYPATTHGCEFVELSQLCAYPQRFKGLVLEGLPETFEPHIFDMTFYYEATHKHELELAERAGARPEKRRRVSDGTFEEIWVDGKGYERTEIQQAGPGKMYLNHVMWIERKGNVAYRIAIGLVYQNALEGKWRESEMFCLG